jgi:hypothetical protein
MKIRKDVDKGKQEERARELEELARSRRELERAEHELSSANARVASLTAELSKYEPATVTAAAQKRATERLAEDLDALGFVLFSARYPARDVSVQIVPGRWEAHGFDVKVTASSPEALLDKVRAKVARSARRAPEPVVVAAPRDDEPQPEPPPFETEAPESGPRVLRGSVASGPAGMRR